MASKSCVESCPSQGRSDKLVTRTETLAATRSYSSALRTSPINDGYGSVNGIRDERTAR